MVCGWRTVHCRTDISVLQFPINIMDKEDEKVYKVPLATKATIYAAHMLADEACRTCGGTGWVEFIDEKIKIGFLLTCGCVNINIHGRNGLN